MKLDIKPFSYFFSRYNSYNPDKLFDGDTSTGVSATWNDNAYVAELPINFGGLVNLEKIRIFDGWGTRRLKIEVLASLNVLEKRTVVYNQDTDKDMQWADVIVNKDVRWVIITLISNKADFPKEFEFYGTPKEELKTIIPVVYPNGKISRKSIGLDSFFWLESKWYKPVSDVRIFTDMDMFTTSIEGINNFENGSGYFRITEKLTEYNKLGIEPIIVFQNTPKWLKNGPNSTNIFKGLPVEYGDNLSDPNSYNKIVQPIVDLVKYCTNKELKFKIEWLNEPDKWWDFGQGKVSLTPFEYAASFYRLHFAVKEVNPNIKILMGGLANPDNWGYIYGMHYWFKDNTGSSWLPYGVNLHRYCTDSEVQGSGSTAKTPEEFDLLGKTRNTLSIIKAFLPNQPIFITEFGYGDGSDQYSFKNVNNLQLVQGSNNILGLIYLALAGVTTTYFYRLDDELNRSVPFGSNGLLTHTQDKTTWKETWLPKVSYKLLEQFSNLLGDKEWDIKIDTDKITLSSGNYFFNIFYNKELKTIIIPSVEEMWTQPIVVTAPSKQISIKLVKPLTNNNLAGLKQELTELFIKYNLTQVEAYIQK